MRITGGRVKGKLLAPFKGLKIRPTSDHVREAIFNILGQGLVGETVLDLFAGTGALGLEAISRGAMRAVFVDRSPKAIAIIRKNVEICGFGELVQILKRDLLRGLPTLETLGGRPFTMVFIDPPYRKGFIPKITSELISKHVLAPGAVVVIESAKSEMIHDVAGLYRSDSRVYGDTKIDFFVFGGRS